jgi:dipeptidase
MVVALARATADSRTLLGHNSSRPTVEAQSLLCVPGRLFAHGETVKVRQTVLPQARHTVTVLGNRPAGQWGYQHGVNEHAVAAGTTAIFSRLKCNQPGLTGPDLVRLVLERAATACQGVDVATDLIVRHGHGADPCSGDAEDNYRDSALLIADRREAYLLAAAGAHWAVQEIGAVRAVTNVCHLRQDWDRVSRGLADLVLERGWWPADGSKIDFEGTVGEGGPPLTAGLRRWGHATLLLEEQNGHIDGHFLRGLLSDHYEGCLDETDPCDPQPSANTLCRHASAPSAAATAVSLIADLGHDGGPPLAWCAFGPPCQSVYFPVVLEGDLPAEFSAEGAGAIDCVWRRMLRLQREVARAPGRRRVVCDAMSALQARFDQTVLDYLDEAADPRRCGAVAEVHRLSTAFMQHNLEQFEDAWLGLLEEARVGVDMSIV